jgi:acetyl-CoA acyltransferase
MKHAVIVGYARTPFTRAVSPAPGQTKAGKLAHVTPMNLMVPVINALVEKTGINPKDVETVLTGCVNQEAEQGLNIARLAILHKDSKLPNSVGGVTVDRFCGSSMHVIADAKNAIQAGEAEVIMCTGVQSMSRIPMTGWNPLIDKEVYESHPPGFLNMGVTAENLARLYKVPRDEQEKFAVKSHQKATAAQDGGNFKKEIVPIAGVSDDDAIRRDASTDALAALKPAFEKTGTVTAGTSSPITDGASGVLVTSEEYAQKNNLPVMARIMSFAGSGCAPEIMGIGPVEASKKALERAGITMKDVDIVELNEAFAAQSLSVLKEMKAQGMEIEEHKLNIDGGAIALGHPLGASGARLVGKAADLLQRTGKRYALATMCIGGGQGVAMVLENPNHKPAAPKP